MIFIRIGLFAAVVFLDSCAGASVNMNHVSTAQATYGRVATIAQPKESIDLLDPRGNARLPDARHRYTLNTGNDYYTINLLRGNVGTELWEDISYGTDGTVTWNLDAGDSTLLSTWKPTLNPTTTNTCSSPCYPVTETITTSTTDKPGFYIGAIQETATTGRRPNQTITALGNWNLVQADMTSVDASALKLNFTLGGGSGTSGPFQAEFDASNGGVAHYFKGPVYPTYGVGSQSIPFHCISLAIGSYTKSNAVWTLTDSFYTIDQRGPSIALKPNPLVIPSQALLTAIENAVGNSSDNAALTKIIGPILAGIQAAGVTDPNQFAAILAQMEIETNFVNFTELISDADAERDYGIANNPVSSTYGGYNKFGNLKSGDGATYKGKGLIQITGRQNYINLGNDLGMDFVDNPKNVADPQTAAEIAAYGLATAAFVPKAGNLDTVISPTAQNYRAVRGMVNPYDSTYKYNLSQSYGTSFASGTGGC